MHRLLPLLHGPLILPLSIAIPLVAVLILWLLFRPRIPAEELERRRREHLALTGRIVDGQLIDAIPTFAAPDTILYRYRIAGVTYECLQHLATLPSPPIDLDLESPVQVRYDRANPADSIVVAETWNGLWTLKRSTAAVREEGSA